MLCFLNLACIEVLCETGEKVLKHIANPRSEPQKMMFLPDMVGKSCLAADTDGAVKKAGLAKRDTCHTFRHHA
jgi:hypothetical protein